MTPDEPVRLRLAVLLSGGGRTLENLLDRSERGDLLADVVCVASNKTGVRGLAIARGRGIDARSFRLSEHSDRASRDREMWCWIHEFQPDFVVLAGYLALLDLGESQGIDALNIHPSLLPSFGGEGFYGRRVHEAVLAAGETRSGCTVHVVDEVFDRGRILGQKEVAVRGDDDAERLAARVFEAECELYPEVLNALARREVEI